MRLTRLVVVAGLLLPNLVGCSTEPSPSAATTGVSYTCCNAEDVDTPYQPGQTMTVHWIVTSENDTAAGSPQVELTAHLTGPYTTVADLKAAESDPRSASGKFTFTAAPVRPFGTPGEQPVSTILIASDAKPGYYNLITSVAQEGATVSGASIVRVVAKA